MSKVFLVSDTHFGHRNIVKFTRVDGSPLRPWDDINHHDEMLIQYWNETVGPKDKVYHLGDSHFGPRGADCITRLNGDKVLIAGNHDTDKPVRLDDLYRSVRSYHSMSGLLLSHIPVHTGQLERRWRGNIHGHLHESSLPDHRYLCVSVEHTNFRPILFEQVLSLWEQRNR